MFYLKSNDELLLDTIIYVLNQKNPIFTDIKEINSFATISISANENIFLIESGKEKISITKPFVFTKLFEEISSILAKIEIYFNDVTYIPVKQILNYLNKSLVLVNYKKSLQLI